MLVLWCVGSGRSAVGGVGWTEVVCFHFCCCFSVLGGDVNVLGAGLLGGDAPSVDVVVALLLLLAVRTLLLQLLPLVLGPPVLEPHLHLHRGGDKRV